MDQNGVTACHSRAVITSSGRVISSFSSRANLHAFSMCRAGSHDVSIDCHILALWSWAILPLQGWNPSICTSPSCTLNWHLTHRINGIPHSLPHCHENYWDSPISSLTGFGIPQFLPWVYGIPHALFRLSPKVFFFGFWDSPILTRGLWDSPCPFFLFAFLRRSFVSGIVIFIAIIAWISTGFAITATCHWVDIGCISNSNINKLLVTRSWRRLNELSTPRNCKTFPRSSKNFQSDHQEFEGPLSSEQGQKRKKILLHEYYPAT